MLAQLLVIAGDRHRGCARVDAKRHIIDDDRPVEVIGACAEAHRR